MHLSSIRLTDARSTSLQEECEDSSWKTMSSVDAMGEYQSLKRNCLQNSTSTAASHISLDQELGCKDELWLLSGEGYRVHEELGVGGFGHVYLVEHTSTGVFSAAKTGDDQDNLRWEAAVLERLSGEPGVPAYHGFHVSEGYGVLLMQGLGCDLHRLMQQCGGRFSLKTVLYTAMQVLDRLEQLHVQGLVHRDVKPTNFARGWGDNASTVFVLDMGLADQFWDDASDCHVALCKDAGFAGSVAFASRHAHKRRTQSRRDDLEAAGYMFVFLLLGTLPWKASWSHGEAHEGFFDHCYQQKSQLPLDVVCKDCPGEFQLYLKYCRSLKFAEDPGYEYLRSLFQDVFKRENFDDDGLFDWPS